MVCFDYLGSRGIKKVISLNFKVSVSVAVIWRAGISKGDSQTALFDVLRVKSNSILYNKCAWGD